MPTFSFLPKFEAGGKRKPKDTSLYELLGVEYTATEDDLKRAYKKRALRLHPDKGGDPAEFDKMKRAYDVLKDEKKRQYYDRYGPKVVAAMEQGGPESAGLMMALLLSQKRYRFLIALTVVAMVGLIDLFPVLVSVKWDGAAWSWGLAFFPVFLVLGVMFIGQLAVLTVSLASRKAKPQENGGEEEEEEPIPKLQMLSMLMLVSLQVVFWAFFSAKLDGDLTTWSWYEVVIPLAVFELWLVLDRWIQLAFTLKEVRALQHRVIAHAKDKIAQANLSAVEDPEASAFVMLEETDRIRHAEQVLKEVRLSKSYLVTSTFWPALRMATWWLLAAKAQGSFTETWFLTAVPFIVGVVLYPCFEASKPEPPSEENGEENVKGGACLTWCSLSCLHCVWLLMWLLGMGKLDNNDLYSAFAIFGIWFALSAFLLLPGLSILCFNAEDMLNAGGDDKDAAAATGAATGAAATTGEEAAAEPEQPAAPTANVIILS
ncbi:hypothetical protein BASA81_000512 [Batrachochytrium salamandrivorans]|nr:hypothetical protein BASA81_000512 [Batrachochytrium salamandrivorans]